MPIAVLVAGALFLSACSSGGNSFNSQNTFLEPQETSESPEIPGSPEIPESPEIPGSPMEFFGEANSISSGSVHTCALREDKTVWCWGSGVFGQLGAGYGLGKSSLTPTQVSGITTASQISAQSLHTCAVLENQTIWCWGSGGNGELGNGSRVDILNTPTQVLGITTATSVSVGRFHTCAVLEDKTIWCWGDGENGKLGNGVDYDFNEGSLTPVKVLGVTTAISVSAGAFHTCTVLEDRTVWCWGSGFFGGLGNGVDYDFSEGSLTPVKVSGITTALQVSVEVLHTCAVLGDQTVWCWGSGLFGRLGNGIDYDIDGGSSTPVKVSGITTALQVSVALGQTCAVLEDKTVWCWGEGANGKLGNGSDADSLIPVQVSGITTATSVSTAEEHSCAVLEDKTVRCWGKGVSGRLGNGSNADSFIPVQVLEPAN